MIKVMDYDESNDSRFVQEFLTPYLRDLFRDLSLRSHQLDAVQQKKLDKVVFIEYCNLPGIINDRLFQMFDTNRDGLISESSFINNLVKILISDLDTRLRITFNMYDKSIFV